MKSHTDFHLFDRILVVATSLVGRKERILESIAFTNKKGIGFLTIHKYCVAEQVIKYQSIYK
jgi:hypothetical protein